MHSAGAAKIWRRLVMAVGVCGYLMVVFVARSTIEGPPLGPPLEGSTRAIHQVAPQQQTMLWIRQGAQPGSVNVTSDKILKDGDSLKNIVNGDVANSNVVTGKYLLKGNDVNTKSVNYFSSNHKMVSISTYLEKKINRAEPKVFVAQNGSMDIIFAMVHAASVPMAKKVNSEAFRDVVLINRRYLIQKADTKHRSTSLDRNTISMRQKSRKGFFHPNKIVPKSRVTVYFAKPKTSTLSPAQDLCANSFIHRRTRWVCRVNPTATECTARPLICNPHLCQVADEDSAADSSVPFLLVIIHSHPSNGYRRDAIRDTWGAIVKDYKRNNLHQRVEFLFLLGSSRTLDESRAVFREVSLYRDIVQFDLDDTYNNLTVKSVLALHWIHTFCSNVTYFLKTDDDAFMNISNIVSYLKTTYRQSGLLLGSLHSKSPVQRTGQWKVKPEVYRSTIYPPYCSGTAYVMTSDVARSLYFTHYNTMYRDIVLLPMEDVYLTGVLARRLHMMCNHSDRFPNWTTGPSPRAIGQFLRAEVLGVHGMSASGMYGLHKLVTQCTTCPTNATTLRDWFALLTGAAT